MNFIGGSQTPSPMGSPRRGRGAQPLHEASASTHNSIGGRCLPSTGASDAGTPCAARIGAAPVAPARTAAAALGDSDTNNTNNSDDAEAAARVVAQAQAQAQAQQWQAQFEDMLKQLRKEERQQRRAVLADEESDWGSTIVLVARALFSSLPGGGGGGGGDYAAYAAAGTQQQQQSQPQRPWPRCIARAMPAGVAERLAPFQRDGVRFLFEHLLAQRLLHSNRKGSAAGDDDGVAAASDARGDDVDAAAAAAAAPALPIDGGAAVGGGASSGCLLGDEMGLGKTVQIAAFLGAWARARWLALHPQLDGGASGDPLASILFGNGTAASAAAGGSSSSSSRMDGSGTQAAAGMMTQPPGNNNRNEASQQQAGATATNRVCMIRSGNTHVVYPPGFVRVRSSAAAAAAKKPLRVLIVCPSTLVPIWVDALRQWAGAQPALGHVEVVSKGKAQRTQQWTQQQAARRSRSPTPAMRSQRSAATVATGGGGGGGDSHNVWQQPTLDAFIARSVSPVPALATQQQQGFAAPSPVPESPSATPLMMTPAWRDAAAPRSGNHNTNNVGNDINDDNDANDADDTPLYCGAPLAVGSALFFVTTYGIMKNDVEDTLSTLPPFDCCVLDEAQLIKDPSTDMFRASVMIRSAFRIAVTGTPLSNHFGDLWSMLYVDDPSVIPISRAQFAKVNAALMRGNERNVAAEDEARARALLAELRGRFDKYVLRREKHQVLDQCAALGARASVGAVGGEPVGDSDAAATQPVASTMLLSSAPATATAAAASASSASAVAVTNPPSSFPTKVDAVLWCHLSPEQEAMYKKFLTCDQVVEALRPGSTASPLVLLSCLIKMCDHPWLNFSQANFLEALKRPLDALAGFAESGAALSSTKVQVVLALSRIAMDDGEKLLVFSRSKRFHDIVASVLCRANIPFVRLDGEVPAQSRADLVRRLNMTDTPMVCLATTQVGGVGLTFNRVSRVVLADPSWNPAVDAQAVDRVHRVGQQSRQVTVMRLVTCGTVEEKMYRNQLHKMIASLQALGTDPQTLLRYFSHTQLRDMFQLDSVMASDTGRALRAVHRFLGGPPDAYPCAEVRAVYERVRRATTAVVDVTDHGSVLRVSADARSQLEAMLTDAVDGGGAAPSSSDVMANGGAVPTDTDSASNNSATQQTPFARRRQRIAAAAAAASSSSSSSVLSSGGSLPPPSSASARAAVGAATTGASTATATAAATATATTAATSVVMPAATTTSSTADESDESLMTTLATATVARREVAGAGASTMAHASSAVIADAAAAAGEYMLSQELGVKRTAAANPAIGAAAGDDVIARGGLTTPAASQSSMLLPKARDSNRVGENADGNDVDDDDDDDDEDESVPEPRQSHQRQRQRLSAQLDSSRQSTAALRHSMAATFWKLSTSAGRALAGLLGGGGGGGGGAARATAAATSPSAGPSVTPALRPVVATTSAYDACAAPRMSLLPPSVTTADASVAAAAANIVSHDHLPLGVEPRHARRPTFLLGDDFDDDATAVREDDDGGAAPAAPGAASGLCGSGDGATDGANDNIDETQRDYETGDGDDGYYNDEEEQRESELLQYFMLDSAVGATAPRGRSGSASRATADSRLSNMQLMLRMSEMRGTLGDVRDSEFALFAD